MNQPQHIILANNVYPPIMAGGAELIVQYLAEELATRGIRVTVVSTCGPEMEPYPVEVQNGVEVIRFFPKNLYWSWERGDRPAYQKALWHMRDAWNTDAGKRFRAILNTHKPDLLHTHVIDGMSAILWRRAKQQGIPVIHTAHDYHLLCPRSVLLTKQLNICSKPQLTCQLYRALHLHTAHDMDIFCGPSEFLINKHLASGLRAKHTAVVRNGIPLPPHIHKIRDSQAPLRFLFISRLTAEKGCQLLIDTMQQLPADLCFELQIAGKGAYEGAFQEAAARDPRIKLLGFVHGEAKTAAFQNADCLLLPSLWYESASVVTVEAASYGLGVIGGRIGALPELIAHEKNGLLFEAGNSSALAAAMQRIIANHSWLDIFRANSSELLNYSSVAAMADNYLQQYKHL